MGPKSVSGREPELRAGLEVSSFKKMTTGLYD